MKLLFQKNLHLFGFINPHNYLKFFKIFFLYQLIKNPNFRIRDKYEKLFASYIGKGKTKSYATARMAFYSILKSINVKKGDEVVLLGFTCSVMVNAVLKTGAKPIFSDVDINTLGSDLNSIKNVVSSKTRVIVAQHSFGIPCDIKPIVDFAKSRKIVLIEDCALTFGSSFNNVKCGNFGDFAIFSTDHSKPINTIIGGIAYSKYPNLIDKLNNVDKLIEFPLNKQYKLFQVLLLEKFFLIPFIYFIYKFVYYFYRKLSIFSGWPDEDFGSNLSNYSYNYPSAMPVFLCYIGILELERWNKASQLRIENLIKFKKHVIAKKIKDIDFYPKDTDLTKICDIVPHRIVILDKKNKKMGIHFAKIIDSSWFWFRSPIVEADVPLIKLFYKPGSCKNSEMLSKRILNLPCHYSSLIFNLMLKLCFRNIK